MSKYKNEIEKLCNVGHASRKIATILNISLSTVNQVRFKYKFKKENRRLKYYNFFENELLLGGLIGTVLGDSYISKTTDTTYNGGFTHSIKQFNYLLTKYNFFRKICTDNIGHKPEKLIYSKEYDKFYNGNEQYCVKFKSSMYLKDLYNIIYCNKKKQINDFVFNNISDVGLAFYYLDDGTLRNGNKMMFCTYDFSKKSLDNFQCLLYEKFNLNSNVTVNNRYGNCITLTKKSSLDFKDLISPYVLEQMRYKLPN